MLLSWYWRQHPTKQQLYSHWSPIKKTIQVIRTRRVGHCWRRRDKLKSYLLLWTPSHGRAKAGRSARTYIQQLCADTGCSLEDPPEAMDNREGWRERSGRSLLMAGHDDDDDDMAIISPCIFIPNEYTTLFDYLFSDYGRWDRKLNLVNQFYFELN